jgi:hypothetical protein
LLPVTVSPDVRDPVDPVPMTLNAEKLVPGQKIKSPRRKIIY